MHLTIVIHKINNPDNEKHYKWKRSLLFGKNLEAIGIMRSDQIEDGKFISIRVLTRNITVLLLSRLRVLTGS